jgi:hypothetical protein
MFSAARLPKDVTVECPTSVEYVSGLSGWQEGDMKNPSSDGAPSPRSDRLIQTRDESVVGATRASMNAAAAAARGPTWNRQTSTS